MAGLIYHPAVPGEVREIIAYYDVISPKLGDAFWNDLSEVTKRISTHPEAGHFESSGRRRCNLRKFPYHVLYRATPGGVRITAVRHNKRDPSFGARRQ